MTDLDTQSIRKRLEERLQEIERTRERLRAEGENMREGELSPGVDQHPADAGSETLEQEVDQTTEVMLDDERGRIQEAIKAIDSGSYGRCVDCGEEIPAERLEARPDAIRCLRHQSEYEGSLRARWTPGG